MGVFLFFLSVASLALYMDLLDYFFDGDHFSSGGRLSHGFLFDFIFF